MDSPQPTTQVTTAALRPAAIALLVIAAALYFFRLNDAPMYLAPDEVIIAGDAHALATTGRTLDGTRLPLYVHVAISDSWFMPYIYYWTALWLQLLPIAEWSIRVPTAVIGIAGLVLVYRVARRLLRDRATALIAAATLGCAPTYFILSRYALDYIYPIPFVLAWLLLLLIGLEPGRSHRWFFASGLALGAGFYSYISSIALMPLFAVMTIVALRMMRRSWRDTAMVAAGFALPLIGFVIWFVQHPEAFGGTAARYGFGQPGQHAVSVAAIAGRYVRFFHPDFLFLSGDSYLPFSTRNDGVFALAAAPLIVLGVIAAVGPRRTPITLLITAAFFAAPLPAALLEDYGAIRRAMVMLPFASLLAGLGAEQLACVARVPWFRAAAWIAGAALFVVGAGYLAWIVFQQGRISPTGFKVTVLAIVAIGMAIMAGRTRHGLTITTGLAAAIALQFVLLQIAYHGEYRVRSSGWLNGNFRGAMLRLIEERDKHPGAKIYFATFRNGLGFWDLKNRYFPPYWHFYLLREGRMELEADTVFMPQNADIRTIPPGSVVLDNIEDPNLRKLLDSGSQRIADIPEADRDPFMTIVIR